MKDIDTIKDILDSCIAGNRVVSHYLNAPGKNQGRLGQLGIQNLALAEENSKIDHMLDCDDFIEICSSYVRKRFGHKAASDTESVMRIGIIEAADHLGGFYSPQSVQGNILYADMLREKLKDVKYMPVFSCGIVPVQNTAHPRGLVCYEGTGQPVTCNVISDKYRNVTVTGMKAFDEKMLSQMKKQIGSKNAPDYMKNVMNDIADNIYGSMDVLKQTRYAEQLTMIGTRLTEKMYENSDFPAFIYIENETVFTELMIRELEMGDTMFCRMIADPALRAAMNRTMTGEEKNTFSMSLFVGLDEKGRRYYLNLDKDGKLRGRSFSGEEKCIDASFSSLIRFLKERTIIPSVLAQVIITGFERGLQWSCGIFASVYIKEWQKRLAEMMRLTDPACGAECAYRICREKCSSYISGPVFMLSPSGDKALANSASVELYHYRPDTAAIKRLLDIDIYDAHLMALYEFYNDMVPKKQKADIWYDRLTGFFHENFGQQVLR